MRACRVLGAGAQNFEFCTGLIRVVSAFLGVLKCWGCTYAPRFVYELVRAFPSSTT